MDIRDLDFSRERMDPRRTKLTRGGMLPLVSKSTAVRFAIFMAQGFVELWSDDVIQDSFCSSFGNTQRLERCRVAGKKRHSISANSYPRTQRVAMPFNCHINRETATHSGQIIGAWSSHLRGDFGGVKFAGACFRCILSGTPKTETDGYR